MKRFLIVLLSLLLVCNLSWWGISDIRVCRFKLMGEVHWGKQTEKKRAAMTSALRKAAGKMLKIDYSRRAHTGPVTKAKFNAVRMIQKQVGKTDSDSVDYRYWKENGWPDRKGCGNTERPDERKQYDD